MDQFETQIAFSSEFSPPVAATESFILEGQKGKSSMQVTRCVRTWSLGLALGLFGLAGGCGSWESGSQIERTTEEMKAGMAVKKKVAAEKAQARKEQMKKQMPGKR
jgi:hypothetical protein